ncbi:hypothetical protein ACFSOV_15095 [Pedobacter petrophilus]|uniref:hypothetical protein n=1 Tax=Pedobacter petrophilus TaxID=1908241 RepID=UPI00142F2360|nr:hypothetical protein [Pedobacter petrophilus]
MVIIAISSILAEIALGSVPSFKTRATLEYEWKNVEFVEEEWDTENKIIILNQQDAKFNNITIDKIIEITKLKHKFVYAFVVRYRWGNDACKLMEKSGDFSGWLY